MFKKKVLGNPRSSRSLLSFCLSTEQTEDNICASKRGTSDLCGCYLVPKRIENLSEVRMSSISLTLERSYVRVV